MYKYKVKMISKKIIVLFVYNFERFNFAYMNTFNSIKGVNYES